MASVHGSSSAPLDKARAEFFKWTQESATSGHRYALRPGEASRLQELFNFAASYHLEPDAFIKHLENVIKTEFPGRADHIKRVIDARIQPLFRPASADTDPGQAVKRFYDWMNGSADSARRGGRGLRDSEAKELDLIFRTVSSSTTSDTFLATLSQAVKASNAWSSPDKKNFILGQIEQCMGRAFPSSPASPAASPLPTAGPAYAAAPTSAPPAVFVSPHQEQQLTILLNQSLPPTYAKYLMDSFFNGPKPEKDQFIANLKGSINQMLSHLPGAADALSKSIDAIMANTGTTSPTPSYAAAPPAASPAPAAAVGVPAPSISITSQHIKSFNEWIDAESKDGRTLSAQDCKSLVDGLTFFIVNSPPDQVIDVFKGWLPYSGVPNLSYVKDTVDALFSTSVAIANPMTASTIASAAPSPSPTAHSPAPAAPAAPAPPPGPVSAVRPSLHSFNHDLQVVLFGHIESNNFSSAEKDYLWNSLTVFESRGQPVTELAEYFKAALGQLPSLKQNTALLQQFCKGIDNSPFWRTGRPAPSPAAPSPVSSAPPTAAPITSAPPSPSYAAATPAASPAPAYASPAAAARPSPASAPAPSFPIPTARTDIDEYIQKRLGSRDAQGAKDYIAFLVSANIISAGLSDALKKQFRLG